ncbi:MAG: glycosyltransferase [Anaerolineae bacterium]
MHITIIALGTRGDVQPMLALGSGLQSAGHEVRIIAGNNFGTWVRAHGFDFVGCGDMAELMSTPTGIRWAESSDNPFRQLGLMRDILNAHLDELVDPIIEYGSQTDLLLPGFISEPFVRSVSQRFGIPMIQLLLQPFFSTRSYAATLTALTRFDSPLNRFSGATTQRLMFNVGREALNKTRAKLGLPPDTFRTTVKANKCFPTIYGFSRYVVPMPDELPPIKRNVAGYWFFDEPEWEPPAALVDFLSAGDPPVYVGFGSMIASDPKTTFDLISDALEKAGRRGVVATGWSGAEFEETPNHVYALDKAPHGWLFPRMAAVIHHGGAGTTGAALRAGVPSLVIPHMTDQPYWARRTYDLGVGVRPIPRHRITLDRLAARIRKATSDPAIHDRAAHLGELIRAEDGIGNAVQWIEQYAKLN